MSVSVSAQISSNRCQSVELRARRETSSPSTMPARPSPTSATSCWISCGHRSAPEVQAPDAFVVPDPLAGAFEPVQPQLEHVGVVGDLEGLDRVLLDHEDRLPAPPQLLDDPEDLLEDERREPGG